MWTRTKKVGRRRDGRLRRGFSGDGKLDNVLCDILLHDMRNSPLSNEVLGKSRQLELALVQNEREEDLHGREHPQLLEVALKEGSKRKGHGIWDKSSLRSAGYSVTKLFECKEEDYPYPQNAAATSTPIGHGASVYQNVMR